MARFGQWRDEGVYSCTGTCFDVGSTVSAALRRWRSTGDAIAGTTDPRSAGNGSLMRLAPVAIRYWNDAGRRHDAAARQSRTTHGAAEAVDACVAYADLIAAAIAGAPRSEVLSMQPPELSPAIAKIMAGSWRGKPRCDIEATGYVVHSLEAALWSVGRHPGFAPSVLAAANLGEDADATAAIAGQLAGALAGAGGIPADWLAKLAWRQPITAQAEQLLLASGVERG
jgi:ADP-ribosyl-[dinitrogen reductase] hydrolase